MFDGYHWRSEYYKLEAKNKKQEKLLVEACEEIMKDTTTGTYDDWRCKFIRKVGIKELLERNEKDES